MVKLKGKLTRSMPNNGSEEVVRFELQDVNSGVIVTRIELNLEDFGRMICGVGRQECEFEIYENIDLIGKKREGKTESIDISSIERTYRKDDFYISMKKLVKPYEVDGWRVDDYSIKSCNHHYRNGNHYSVGFTRYVEESK